MTSYEQYISEEIGLKPPYTVDSFDRTLIQIEPKLSQRRVIYSLITKSQALLPQAAKSIYSLISKTQAPIRPIAAFIVRLEFKI